MNKSLQMIIVLVVVGAVSGAALVAMEQYAKPLIEKNKEIAAKEAIQRIFPDGEATKIEGLEGRDVYRVAEGGQTVGYAFKAAGNGYQGKIVVMVGIDTNLKTVTVKGIDILESVETPGLGAKIQGKSFKDQFEGLSALPNKIVYVKNQKVEKPNEIEAITGATISSKSVVRILNEEISALTPLLKSK